MRIDRRGQDRVQGAIGQGLGKLVVAKERKGVRTVTIVLGTGS